MSEQIARARHLIRLQTSLTEKLFAAAEEGISAELREARTASAMAAAVKLNEYAIGNAVSLALAFLRLTESTSEAAGE